MGLKTKAGKSESIEKQTKTLHFRVYYGVFMAFAGKKYI